MMSGMWWVRWGFISTKKARERFADCASARTASAAALDRNFDGDRGSFLPGARLFERSRSIRFMDREPALKLFEKFRFRHSRSRTVGGKELKYFYRDFVHTEPTKGD